MGEVRCLMSDVSCLMTEVPCLVSEVPSRKSEASTFKGQRAAIRVIKHTVSTWVGLGAYSPGFIIGRIHVCHRANLFKGRIINSGRSCFLIHISIHTCVYVCACVCVCVRV